MLNHPQESALPFANSHAWSLMPRSGLRWQGKVAILTALVSLINPSSLAQVPKLADGQSPESALTSLLAAQPAVNPGQSATQLPDGRWLLLGGNGEGQVPTADAAIVGRGKTESEPLKSKLKYARSGHSATLLPDGLVLVLGGVDAAGAVLNVAEQFDAATNQFQVVDELALIARSGHTATVLANRQLLISGGVDQRGRALYEAEILNLATRKSEQFNVKLDTARINHIASLLPGSDVLLWGGVDNAHKNVDASEIFKFDSQRFGPIADANAAALAKSINSAGAPGIRSTQPASDDTAAPVDHPLVVQFTQRMNVSSLNGETVTLIGPNGVVPAKTVPVEYGLLMFVTPEHDLMPASAYTLFIKGAANMAGKPLPFTAVGFGTAPLAPPSGPSEMPTEPGAADLPPTATQSASNTGPSARPVTAAEQHLIEGANKVNQTETWLPDVSHLKGDWRARRGTSPLQELPPLRAADGVTALAGQVLTLHGRALEGVTLSVGGQSTVTDATGRFLLTQLESGDRVLTIEGQTANRGGMQYGTYQVRVKIEESATSVLNYTIWSSRLDPAGNAALPSPTVKSTVVTSPSIPGLELHIPVGTVIQDRNGKIVTKINMTAIPTDRPPFPIPDVGVPTYFTIQPGGAKLINTGSLTQQGARLIYPNFSGAIPGTSIDFWNYDVQRKGWYVYGKGTVTKDGKQVVPDPGVAIYEFTGAMISLPSGAPPVGPPPGGCPYAGGDCAADPNQPPPPSACAGDPVDCATGLFLNASNDLVIDDVTPIRISRVYRPRDPASRAFGIGTNLGYDIFLVGDTSPWTYQELILPDGGRLRYERTSSGTSYSDAVYRHTATGTKYFGSTISYTGTACYWKLQLKDGASICFPESMGSSNPRKAAATSMRDRFGNTITFQRDSNGNLTKIVSPGGRYFQLSYDAKNRIVQAGDNIGRTIGYEYDASGRLIKVTDPLGKFEAFTYDGTHNMLTVQDKRGNMTVTNEYDQDSRVRKQTYADGTSNQFSYTFETYEPTAGSGGGGVPIGAGSTRLLHTDVTNSRGIVSRMEFNASGYVISIIKALGLPEQQVTSFERQPGTNLLLSQTDAMGRKTAYTYDANGNQLSLTLLADTANAVVASMTYTADFNKLATYTDFLGRQTTMSYDSQGRLIQVQDPNGNQIGRSYNAAGQITQLTNALGKSVNVGYEGFDVAQVSDPLNRTVAYFTDTAGRVRSSTDSLGNKTTFGVDALDRLIHVIDPLNNEIAASFDDNGNQTRVTDPKGNQHQFVFNTLNVQTSSTDPLNQTEAYVYDGQHNLTRRTDRKGQITTQAFDALDRLTSRTYADGSTIAISYDQASRPTQLVDSVNGTITWTYDNRDQVTQVSTPKGSVAYTYDANGFRHSMSVAGQPTLTYSYDPGRRLTRIDQAAGPANNNVAQSISFLYDAANRRTKITYINGMTRLNGYDDAGQLTSIVYKNADGSVFGDLVYTYDIGGRRRSTSGSLAHVTLPDALPTAAVDAANRLTAVGAQNLTYDANGNLIGDGSQTYVWNARDQLVQIMNSSNIVIASFSYDALGRRQTKTVDGVATSFVYDGANIVQELAGIAANNSDPSTVSASYISGGIDEIFAQSSGTGTTAQTLTYLSDALGSTIRLVDATGAKVVGYSYDPYGDTSADAIVHNPFQYTGRENDGAGLYYYRARYYSTNLARFISSDPIGLMGGINTYAYVGGNPVSYTDPSGLIVPALAIPIIGGGIGLTDIGIGIGLGAGLIGLDRIFSKPPENAYDPKGPKAPGKPGEAEGFCPPKGGDDWVKNPNGNGYGWRDKGGDVWVPTGPYDPSKGDSHGGSHWDVQTPGGGYVNIYPGGGRR